MPTTTRRQFLAATSAAALAGAAAPAAREANSRIRVALVGLGGRANAHLQCLLDLAGDHVELAALCDVDATLLGQRIEEVAKKTSKKPAACEDRRRAFDDQSIDAVSFATPNHWHALGTIWACQAGKDVYVEKPGAHNVFEGRQMVKEGPGSKGAVLSFGSPSSGPSPRFSEGTGGRPELGGRAAGCRRSPRSGPLRGWPSSRGAAVRPA